MGKILVAGKRLNLGVRSPPGGRQDRVVSGVATLDRSPDQSLGVRPISPSHPPGWSTDQVGLGVHTLELIFFLDPSPRAKPYCGCE